MKKPFDPDDKPAKGSNSKAPMSDAQKAKRGNKGKKGVNPFAKVKK